MIQTLAKIQVSKRGDNKKERRNPSGVGDEAGVSSYCQLPFCDNDLLLHVWLLLFLANQNSTFLEMYVYDSSIWGFQRSLWFMNPTFPLRPWLRCDIILNCNLWYTLLPLSVWWRLDNGVNATQNLKNWVYVVFGTHVAGRGRFPSPTWGHPEPKSWLPFYVT